MHLFKNDFGVDITLTVTDAACNPVDISAATTKEFELEKPDGTIVTVTAAFVTTGVDGKLRYSVAAGVLDVVGTWSARAHIVEGMAKGYRTDKVEFEVRS